MDWKCSFLVLMLAIAACTSSDPYDAYNNGDYKTAREKLEPLAAANDPVAENYLGTIYQMGLGVKKDYQRAYDLYEKAAKSGYAAAQYNTGLMLYEGLGRQDDRPHAYGWFYLAAEQGHELAQERLEQIGMHSDVIPNQVQPAIKWARDQLR